MNTNGGFIAGAWIQADESADWKVGGLRQLDRTLFALNEYASRTGHEPLTVLVSGTESPRHSRLNGLSLTSDFAGFLSSLSEESLVLVLNTHLVIDRGGVEKILETAGSEQSVPALLVGKSDLAAHSLAAQTFSPSASDGWTYLAGRAGIVVAENQMLASTGKSQDGVISRFINRPISRAVTRRLLPFDLKPNQWTLLITVIPLLGSMLLLRGDYPGFALGALLFQLHSILDGCDGEIARIKYQESASGRKLDALCDRFSTLLYAIALGLGLGRQVGLTELMRWWYPMEGLLAALLIGVGETWLTRTPIKESMASDDSPYPEYVKNELGRFNEGDQLKLWTIKSSGMLFFGQKAASLFAELTKRDVFNFSFMLFAVCGWPQVTLHLLAFCACGIAIFAVKEFVSGFDPKTRGERGL